jgi:hypothetical protein
MPRDHTEFEDALQIKPADLDLRILDSIRSAPPAGEERQDLEVEESPDAEDAITPDLFADPAPKPIYRDAPSPPPPRVISNPAAPNGGAWTIPLVCLGLGIIAMSLIIPAADENRRLVYERERLARDLSHVQKQIAINDEFLARLATDPGLAERLAQRQMKMVREGTSVLELPGRSSAGGGHDISPFELVTLPPPPPMPEYRPIGGKISRLFHHPKVRLYLLGAGLLSLIVGVILGSTKDRPEVAWAARA